MIKLATVVFFVALMAAAALGLLVAWAVLVGAAAVRRAVR